MAILDLFASRPWKESGFPMNWRWFLLLLLLLPMAGCSGDAADGEADARQAPVSEIIRGEYLFSHEVRALRPCGEEEDLWVIDPTQLLAKIYGQFVEGRTGDIRIRVVAKGRIGPPPTEGFGAGYSVFLPLRP